MDDTEAEPELEAATLPAVLKITLSPPVMVNQTAYTELVLREPTLSQVQVAHMELDDSALPSIASERRYMLAFVAVTTRKPRDVVDALPVRYLRQAVDYLEAWVRAPMPELDGEPEAEFVLQLEPPIKANGGEVGELALREPTGGEMRRAEELLGKGGVPLPGPIKRYQAKLLEQVTGHGPLVIGQLPISASKQAVRYLEYFERSARPTPTP